MSTLRSLAVSLVMFMLYLPYSASAQAQGIQIVVDVYNSINSLPADTSVSVVCLDYKGNIVINKYVVVYTFTTNGKTDSISVTPESRVNLRWETQASFFVN